MKASNNSTSPKAGPLSGVKIESLVAGISGGLTSALLLHPLDLLKTRFAATDVTGPSGSNTAIAARPHYDGLRSAVLKIARDEGYRGFYKGVVPNMCGSGCSWGLYFLFYNGIKSWLQGGDTKKHLGPTLHMIAAAQAGVLTISVTNPIFVVKTRLCLQYDSPGGVGSSPGSANYKGMADVFVKTYRQEGIRGLYKGLVPGWYGVSHGALQFMAYEELKAQYNKYRSLPIDAKLSSMEYLTFAAVSKLFAAITTFPYHVLRTRMQDQHSHYTNVRHCIKETWRVNGARGFYRGLVPNLIRVVPATGITFVIYENLMPYLKSFREEQEIIDSVNKQE